MIPPGLLCAACNHSLYPHLARRTRDGYRHASACPIASPHVLTGTWVRQGHVLVYREAS
jgi:hypothetical protein